MPLAICFLLSLTLLDQFSPTFLKPKLKDSLQSQIGEELTLVGIVDEPVRVSPIGLKVVVSLEEDEKILQPPVKMILWLDPSLADLPLNRGTRVRFWTKIRRPTHYQNPGGFDYRRSLEREGILLSGSVKANHFEILGQEKKWQGTFDKFRESIKKKLHLQLSEPEAGFLTALLTGDVSNITPELRDDFVKTGTSHLIAISGQHIVLIGATSFAILLLILRSSPNVALRISIRRSALLLTLPLVIFYTLLAGMPPSAVRATLLWCLLVFATILRRDLDPLSALAFGGLLIGLSNPASVFSVSFQLSFLAVLGLILIVPGQESEIPPSRLLRFVTKYLQKPFFITLAAMLATGPWIAYVFHTVSLSTLLVNLWAVPLVSILLIFSAIAVGLAIPIPLLGNPLIRLSGFLSKLILILLHRSSVFSDHHGLVLSFYPTEWETFLLYLGVAALVWLLRSPRDQWRRRFVIVGASLSLIISGLIAWRALDRDLEVTFLDVGQGDATLVRTPSGKNLLVDGGGFLIPGEMERHSQFDVGRDVIVPYLKRLGIKRIDAVLLSHPHPDHFGGLPAVLNNFEIGEFWWNGQTFPDETFASLLESVSRRAATEKILKDGDHWSWGDCEFEVIYPERIDLTRNINDNSLVVRLTCGETRILFPGDIEKEGEQALADHRDIRADILKIPHHASRTSSSIAFIDSVQPQYAVASLGDGNLFGFPHPGVLEKYERRRVKIFRTDCDGAVTMKISSNFRDTSIRVKTSSGH